MSDWAYINLDNSLKLLAATQSTSFCDVIPFPMHAARCSHANIVLLFDTFHRNWEIAAILLRMSGPIVPRVHCGHLWADSTHCGTLTHKHEFLLQLKSMWRPVSHINKHNNEQENRPQQACVHIHSVYLVRWTWYCLAINLLAMNVWCIKWTNMHGTALHNLGILTNGQPLDSCA